MKFGKIQHVSQLVLGDIVRAVAGHSKVLFHVPTTEAEHLARDLNRGLMPEIGGADDFRQGYDTMTVVAIDESEVVCHRPHIHMGDEMQHWSTVQVGVEIVRYHLDHGGAWFELLQEGSERRGSK